MDSPSQVTSLSIEDLDVLKHLLAEINARRGMLIKDHCTNENGVIILDPWIDPVISTLKTFLYDNRLIIVYDWNKWQGGRDFLKSTDKNKFHAIDRDTVLKLLSAFVRNDRVHEGAWAMLFESGEGEQLLSRLIELEEARQVAPL